MSNEQAHQPPGEQETGGSSEVTMVSVSDVLVVTRLEVRQQEREGSREAKERTRSTTADGAGCSSILPSSTDEACTDG